MMTEGGEKKEKPNLCQHRDGPFVESLTCGRGHRHHRDEEEEEEERRPTLPVLCTQITHLDQREAGDVGARCE